MNRQEIEQELAKCQSAIDIFHLSRRVNDSALEYLRDARKLHRQSRVLATIAMAWTVMVAIAAAVLS